ncbi:hypothetical protein AIOL_000782 [Candidatus Rhodobacter oscarellae]|uniref:Uncharacterized protein n=1 Tax=Candidatus Rhodobacter oscarellae TaxID=1675527 RepID=A0A0J9H4X1_9RHOB|nr:hypothetical protein [Candidatus Rhodobacter lobularis]KMW60618.1 hypothetical protein AIOL_000782 [Candidatus Rhodobacter lobularis]
MFAALTSLWAAPPTYKVADHTQYEPPKPPRSPVLMGDIINSWGGEPVLLQQWRADAQDAREEFGPRD